MKQILPQALVERKKYVVQLLKDQVLPTKRNFLPLTYDMKESLFGSIVGTKPSFVYLPIDTSHMTVMAILEEEERIISERKERSIKVVTQQDQDEMLSASLSLSSLVSDKKLETDKEKIEAILAEYPKLLHWIQEY